MRWVTIVTGGNAEHEYDGRPDGEKDEEGGECEDHDALSTFDLLRWPNG